MATHTDPTVSMPRSQYRSQRRWLGLGFVWGGLVLGLLAIWLGARRDLELPALIAAVWIWAGATLALGIGLLSQFGGAAGDADAEQRLVKLRQTFGLILFGYTILLLGLAGLMASQRGLKSFGEVSSMILLALVTGFAGLALRG